MSPTFGEPPVWSGNTDAPDRTSGYDDVSGGGGDDGPGDLGGGPGGHGPDGEGPSGAGPGRWRWVALLAGFAVLVAVIAVQHAAGGGNAGGAADGISTALSGSHAPSGSAGRTATGSPSEGPSTDEVPPDISGSVAAEKAISQAREALSQAAKERSSAASPSDLYATTPVTTTAPGPAALAGENTEIVGYAQPGQSVNGTTRVVRYHPSTGRVVNTQVLELPGRYGVHMAVTTSGVILLPGGVSDGFFVPDGRPARKLTGAFRHASVVLPGPDSDHVWVSQRSGDSLTLIEVDAAGEPTGTTIQVPAALAAGGSGLIPDRAGHVLARAIGGTYLLQPSGTSLVTHGVVLAAGPKTFVLYECDATATCRTVVVDRKSGDRRRLPGFAPTYAGLTQGVVSADGRYAAMLDLGNQGPQFSLVDLRSGQSQRLSLSPPSNTALSVDATQPLAFTPDSRYLLLATDQGVVPVRTADGSSSNPLPMPPVQALAVRPG